MGGGGRGGGNWVQGGFFARLRARRQVLEATEAELRERGLPIPKVPMSKERSFGIGLLCAVVLGALIGLIVWKLD